MSYIKKWTGLFGIKMNRSVLPVFLPNGVYLKKLAFTNTRHLDGQGADETHCGYKSFLRPFVIGQIKQKKFGELWKTLKLIRPNRLKAIGSIIRGILDCYIPTFINDWVAYRKENQKERLVFWESKKH